jgi:DNA-binding transcriptional ArsR family regulator
MTRRTAVERHLASAPRPSAERSPSDDLAELLMAFHHPIRRWLTELLGVEGPANVGQLAAATGMAVGSVSHHLKVLHQQDLIEPAPELARDTRESWWRLKSRSMTWSVDDFDEGTLGRRVAQTAEVENLRFQVRAMQEWLKHAPEETSGWRSAAGSTDTYVPATEEQVREFAGRLSALFRDWSAECMAEAEQHPDVPRRPIRAIARVFPSEPVRP